jgi:Phosphate-selective porin O and P
VEHTELGGRVHLQFNTTSGDGPSSEFLLRRARIWAATRVNDWIDGAAQIDFSGGKVAARYAFVRLAFNESTRLSFGQFKRAFDVFELTSSSQILVIERSGNIRGVESACAGIGGVCSYSRFSEKLQLSSLDVGMLLQGELADGRVGYLLSLTNGTGGNAREENDTKSFAGRVEWFPVEKLRLGANVSVHDYPNEVTASDEVAPAFAFDAEVGDFERGLHIQAGIMSGRNWRKLTGTGDEARFLTYQGIVSYRAPLSHPGRVLAVEPVGRVSWGDPDRSTARDGGLLLTPGVVLHFQDRNKMAANLDVWNPASGQTTWGLKLQTYLYF